MFSGIIEHVGKIRSLSSEGAALRLTLTTNLSDMALGESIAVNGVCLTVTRHHSDGEADFFVSPETIERSNLGNLYAGAHVNLERAVTIASRLSGHLVQGHVDGKGYLSRVEDDSEAKLIELLLPENLHPFCVEKGSIALNGVSLTLNAIGRLNDCGQFKISIMLIPHTWTHTTFRHIAVGDEVNVEVDIIAKYVERLCRGYLMQSNG